MPGSRSFRVGLLLFCATAAVPWGGVAQEREISSDGRSYLLLTVGLTEAMPVSGAEVAVVWQAEDVGSHLILLDARRGTPEALARAAWELFTVHKHARDAMEPGALLRVTIPGGVGGHGSRRDAMPWAVRAFQAVHRADPRPLGSFGEVRIARIVVPVP